MIRTVMAFLADEPPTLCCWLPWNHTAGGNHNFGIVLYNVGLSGLAIALMILSLARPAGRAGSPPA